MGSRWERERLPGKLGPIGWLRHERLAGARPRVRDAQEVLDALLPAGDRITVVGTPLERIHVETKIIAA